MRVSKLKLRGTIFYAYISVAANGLSSQQLAHFILVINIKRCPVYY